MTQQEIETRLQEITDNLVKEFNPDKVILFGSYAKGKQRADSSIDILIIARTTLHFIDRIKKAIKATDGEPPIEPLIYTQSEMNVLLSQGEGFIDSILKEGRLLYSKE